MNKRKSQDLNLTVNLVRCDPPLPSTNTDLKPQKSKPTSSPPIDISQNKNSYPYDSKPLFPPNPEGVRGLIRSIGLSPTEVQNQHIGSLPAKVGKDRGKRTRLSNPECKLKC